MNGDQAKQLTQGWIKQPTAEELARRQQIVGQVNLAAPGQVGYEVPSAGRR